MKIYNSKDQLLLDVIVDDGSYRHRVIKGEHNLTLKYSLAEHVELPIGAYCQYQGELYTLERPESFKMKHSRNFEYTVIMEAYQAKARIWKFRNTVDGRLKFPLTARPKEHLQMFIDNMNRRDKGWTVGQCIDDIEHLINYDHDFCWDALGKMATEFKTEFEIVGKRVSLHKVEYNKNNPLPLSYGYGNGFKAGLGRNNGSDNPPIEILYVQGGTQNIDRSKYGNSELLLPKGQSIAYDGEHFEGDTGFNAAAARRYVVDEQGLSVRRSDKPLSSLAEDSLDCSTIYPKRVGTISSVVAVDVAKNFYDIIDNSIPSALNFENCLIAGETMTIIFQSGMLAGREFEVKYYHDAKTIKGVQKTARRFEIVPQEIDGITMPNAIFSPRTGDKYAVFKVMLPQAYICDNATKTGAEWDMFKTAVKYLFDNEEQKFSFTGELDGIWAKKGWVNIGGRIVLGGYILFRNERFQKEGVLLRITGIKDYINKPHSPVIEISNKTVSSGFTSDLKKLESSEVLMDEYHKEALQFTKRRFRDAKETMGMLEAAMMENFTNSVSPIAIQTMQMLVGDESLQFRFVNNRIKPVPADHKIIFDNATKQLKASAGIMQHLTLGIKSISTNHSVSEYKFWNVSSFTSARLDKPSDTYYLYIKANKANETADFILSKKIIKMEEVNGYYYFLVGLLGSEYDGERSFNPLYGFTEVLPGRITTDKIVSGDGTSYFDMLANAMKLGDMLQYNVNGDGRLKLRGTIVQSQSGDESPIGCFRGNFNTSHTYYSGDEITYLINGSYSTYRYINATPSKGHLPTETAYWSVIAQGQKGEPGRPGSNGKNAYTFTRYSDDGGKTFTKVKLGLVNNLLDANNTLVQGAKIRDNYFSQKASGNSERFITFFLDNTSKAFAPNKTYCIQANVSLSQNNKDVEVFIYDKNIKSVNRAQYLRTNIGGNAVIRAYIKLADNSQADWSHVYIRFDNNGSTDAHDSQLDVFNIRVTCVDDLNGVNQLDLNATTIQNNLSGKTTHRYFTEDNLPCGATRAMHVESGKDNDGIFFPNTQFVYPNSGMNMVFSVYMRSNTVGLVVRQHIEGNTFKAQSLTPDWKRYEVVANGTGKGHTLCLYTNKAGDFDVCCPQFGFPASMMSDTWKPSIQQELAGTTSGTYLGIASWDKPYPPLAPQMYQWSKATGENGKDADYQEYRFAKNGSTTTAPTLNKSMSEPIGWTLEQPVIGKMEYLWATIAKKKADGTLLTPWSEPIRMTPYEGKDGKDGVSPALVFCGVYSPSKTYYGNQYRIDACKYGNAYYVCRVDAGEFKGVIPTSTSKWNPFGASFESIATNLLLAEGANIGDWFISQGKIVSTLNGNKKIIFDAVNTLIQALTANSSLKIGIEDKSNGDVEIVLSKNNGSTVSLGNTDKGLGMFIDNGKRLKAVFTPEYFGQIYRYDGGSTSHGFWSEISGTDILFTIGESIWRGLAIHYSKRTGQLSISMKDLPTNANDISSGMLYVENGYLRIKP